MSLRVAVVGETFAASRTPQRIQALRGMGHQVTAIATLPEGHCYETRPTLADRIRYRLRRPADKAGANAALLEAARRGLDLVWLDNATTIRPVTLEALRALSPGVKVAWYCEDDMMNPRLGSIWLDQAMPLFDLWVTTKSFNARPHELPSRGVRRILVVDNCYDPVSHFSVELEERERVRWGAEISFIGTYEAPRAASLLHLAQVGLPVRVWGNGWGSMAGVHPLLNIEGRPVYGHEFRSVVAATALNLCFLRKTNRDLQTCRSIELPACGGFMIHERNDEIAALLHDGVHAVLFSDDRELIDLCAYWRNEGAGRAAIAAAGRRRVAELGLNHAGMLGRALAELGLD